MQIFDPRSEAALATLHPKAREKARAFMAKAVPAMEARGLVVKIINGLRTYAEQDALFAQGRTAPGRVVTKARGGFSNHNFGTAFDVALFRGPAYLDEDPHYAELGKIGQSVGLEWGGSWQFSDEPHFEVRTGLTMEEKRNRRAIGKDLFSS
jgi:peptidoglycan L-alanyl-D-glutamate endopeptidase CwlK